MPVWIGLTWENIKTEDQKKRLTQAVINEIEKLKRSPALSGILKNLILGYYEWAPGGWHDALKIDKNGRLLNCWCGEDDKASLVQERELERLIRIMRISPQKIKQVRQEIER